MKSKQEQKKKKSQLRHPRSLRAARHKNDEKKDPVPESGTHVWTQYREGRCCLRNMKQMKAGTSKKIQVCVTHGVSGPRVAKNDEKKYLVPE